LQAAAQSWLVFAHGEALLRAEFRGFRRAVSPPP
jgi:hypothetical protein